MDDNRKKILYIITKSIWGGATKYTTDLATGLPRSEFEVFVAGGSLPSGYEGKNLFDELRNVKAQIFEIKNFQKSINPFKEVLAFFEILSLLQNIEPDVVHTSSSKAGGIAGLAIFIYKSIKKLTTSGYKLVSVFTAHGWAFHESQRHLWQRFVIRWLSRLTVLFYDQVVTVSEFDRKSAVENKIGHPDKFVTIHNGIDAGLEFVSHEEARGVLCQELPLIYDFWVGTIGEFTGNKGQKFLIGASTELVKKYPKMKFMIIGHHGEERPRLEKQILDFKLNNSVFLIESPPDAAKYLKAFDIFVLPSLKEGLPYVILEAGLASVSTIATNVGGIPEIVTNEKEGLIVSSSNPKELANAIARLADDSEIRATLAKNLNQKILSDFSIEKMLKETVKIY